MSVQKPCDPSASPAAERLLEWLSALPGRADRRVVIGQYITRNRNNSNPCDAAEAWDRFYEEAGRQSGEYPALAGFDFSGRSVDGVGEQIGPADSEWRAYALRHHERGGLLRFMWHAGNPWTLETSWSKIPEGRQLAELATPGNEAYVRWRGWLEEIADMLEPYAKRDIPVIWGPLHEMNGRWFWWGTGAEDQYGIVWNDMFRYFTETRGLHNLLWMFCPDVKASVQRAVEQYPGNGAVDLIAPDLYYVSADAPANSHLYDEFSDAKYGKTLGWGEIGVSADERIDNRKFIREIRDRFPLITMYMQWGDVVSAKTNKRFAMTSNDNVAELMRDPWAITLGGLVRMQEEDAG